MGLSHLFFADDVFLFCEANLHTATLLKEGLNIFSSWSGLCPNPCKSEIFLAGGNPSLRNDILLEMGFREGSLLVRYLGVPIITSRINKADCCTLVNRITARVQSWTHRFLSIAGRIQLIRSVLHAIQAYWASVFVLPIAVMDQIEKIFRQFLWKGPDLGKGGAKVAWDEVCLPKDERGLGIRRLQDCNKAAMLKHIWLLFSDKEALWCRWVHSTFLKNKNFWVATKPTSGSWAWKSLLILRRDFRMAFYWKIGDGQTTSLWFDNWHPRGPLNLIFLDSLIYSSGLSRQACVADLFSDAGQALRLVLETWGHPLPILMNAPDRCCWRESSSGQFTMASAWNFIRKKRMRVHWYSFIWDNAIVPRYQINLWLMAKRRLPTQDLLLSYGIIGSAACAFCKNIPDSLDHLFFYCCITARVAFFGASRCNLPWRNRAWGENFRSAATYLMGKDFYKCIARFSFGALCHIIWKNRNNIIFRDQPLSVLAMKNHLFKVVRDKAITYRNVEDNFRNRRLQRSWSLDPIIFTGDP